MGFLSLLQPFCCIPTPQGAAKSILKELLLGRRNVSFAPYILSFSNGARESESYRTFMRAWARLRYAEPPWLSKSDERH